MKKVQVVTFKGIVLSSIVIPREGARFFKVGTPKGESGENDRHCRSLNRMDLSLFRIGDVLESIRQVLYILSILTGHRELTKLIQSMNECLEYKVWYLYGSEVMHHVKVVGGLVL